MDRFPSIILAAAFGCFAISMLLSAVYPWAITDARQAEASIADVAANITEEFASLKESYPVSFRQKLGDAAAAADAPLEVMQAAHAEALQRGRDLYVGEGCWHCHSQFVRPVANEEARFGHIRTPAEENNALQRPVLWGTRRVGPDLTNEGGKRSNDWHVAHLYDPRSTSPGSVMPGYTWYFREGFQVFRRIDPNKAEVAGLDPDTSYPYPGLYDTEEEARAALEKIKASLDPTVAEEGERLFVQEAVGPDGDALCIIAYLQWLGTWFPEKPTEE